MWLLAARGSLVSGKDSRGLIALFATQEKWHGVWVFRSVATTLVTRFPAAVLGSAVNSVRKVAVAPKAIANRFLFKVADNPTHDERGRITCPQHDRLVIVAAPFNAESLAVDHEFMR